jgi:methionine biosynthesis protein MetW
MGVLSPYRLARARTIGGILKRGDSVLDLGVGDGAILKHLIDTVGVEGYGLDISADAVQFCQAQGLNVELGDINQPLGAFIDRQFDAIVMAEIIEHIPDPENLLNALRSHTRLLIVTTPNTGYFHHRLRLLFGRFPLQWVVTPGEHLRFWTVRDFRWWAAQLGFRITHQSAYTGTPVLRKVWPNLFGQGVMYVLEESPGGR